MRSIGAIPPVYGSSMVWADAVGSGHMGGWGWTMAIFGWFFMLLIVALVVWLIWSATRTPDKPERREPDALGVLDERYARGEIDREEYLQRRSDLEQ